MDKVENKFHTKNRELAGKIQDNAREIANLQNQLREQLPKLVAEAAKNAVSNGPAPNNNLVQQRRDAREAKYLIARRSFRIWPLHGVTQDNEDEVVKKFLSENMGVPDSVLDQTLLDTIRPTMPGAKSRIQKEYVVTFADVEMRDTIKSYASGLAKCKGEAGLRLELPENLKTSHKILEEHALAIKNLYGGQGQVKRNIRFDDRSRDLMMDLKLPTGNTWHNVTIVQATEAKKIREELDLKNMRFSAGLSAPPVQIAGEKARALMLHVGHEHNGTPTTGANSLPLSERCEPARGGNNATDDSLEFVLGNRNGIPRSRSYADNDA